MPLDAAPPLFFANARLVDPASGTETRGALLVQNGAIADFGVGLTAPEGAHVIDCGGDVLAPGLIDMQAFVGEPGAEHRETIATATAAAAAGGVTTLVATSATLPAVDDPAVVDFVLRRARDTGRVRVLPMAALTKGREGKEIAELGLLKQAGAVAFFDGARSVANALVMRRAMTYARDFDALVVHFTQDADLVGAGVMNEGELAQRLGLAGAPREAEAIVIDRDLRLVALTGARYHAAIVSTTMSLDALRAAKSLGLPVSCGASINHLTLNENDIGDYRSFLKLRPPLRHEDERKALVAALAEGLIDVIVSDHDPQDVETKRLPFAEAEYGAVGIETMLAAGLRLVHQGDVTLTRLLAAMSSRPAEILGLPQGRLARGAPADLIRFDPCLLYTS
ncbi:MAG: dihydroorotase, partial [Methylocystis sp.]|nr:dihydroorotase [Methylocystis sp.]